MAPVQAHQHAGCVKRHSSRENGHSCHCAAPKAFECQKCSRDRHIREAQR
jgi:hypothetical protein